MTKGAAQIKQRAGDARGRVLDLLRSSSLYPYYRRLRSGRRQLDEFESILRRVAALPLDLDVAAAVARQLRARQGQRLALPRELSEAVVVSMGAYGWEQYGLWPSWGRVAKQHHHFSDGLGIDQPMICHTEDERRRRSDRLVQFVRTLSENTPVHLVFMYADTSNFDRSVFDQLHALGCWTVLMGLDDRHTFVRFRRGELEVGAETVAPSADLYWTTWRAGTFVHSALGSRPWLGGLAADPAFYRPLGVGRDIPVLFLGQRYGLREEAVVKLRALGVPVVARGHGWEGGFMGFDETIQLMARAEVVLGMSNVGAMDGVAILKGRDFEAPMCGVCYLTQWSPELGDFFEVGRDVACYGSFPQAAEEALSLLRDAPRRREMRRRALEVSLRKHTWEMRLKEMYSVLQGGLPPRSSDESGAA